MTEVAVVITALAALGALIIAWRTVVEARAAHAEDERDRRLSRIERLAVALTELAADLDSVTIARARITQTRARVLWAAAGADFGEEVRDAVVTPITTEAAAAADLAEKARAASDSVLTGLDDFLCSVGVGGIGRRGNPAGPAPQSAKNRAKNRGPLRRPETRPPRLQGQQLRPGARGPQRAAERPPGPLRWSGGYGPARRSRPR